MERRDQDLGDDSLRQDSSEREDSYRERDQRLADEAREERDLERERDDIERARDIEVTRHADLARSADEPTVGEQLGEAAGGISGVVAGAAIGSLGGPIGTLIGGIAGAIGGWWAGRAISDAAARVSDADDEHYRRHYDSLGARRESTSYDDARPAYHLGHIAGYNPGYAGREFEEIEPELERGWTSTPDTGSTQWTGVRAYARAGYVRSREAARDASWLSQGEAVRTGDSFESATPDLASSAASRPALEGEEISPAMLDYMADNTEGSSGPGQSSERSTASGSANANAGLSSQGSSGSFASNSSGGVPGDAETPRGTAERASSMEAVPDSSSTIERGPTDAPPAGDSAETTRTRGPSSASGATGESTRGEERPSFNDPAGPANADRSLFGRDEGSVFSMDDGRETRSIGDADVKDGRGMRDRGDGEKY